MTNLILRDSPSVQEQIPTFRAILARYGIAVLECVANGEDKTLKITTDAQLPLDIRAVNAAAYDCFEDQVVSYHAMA